MSPLVCVAHSSDELSDPPTVNNYFCKQNTCMDAPLVEKNILCDDKCIKKTPKIWIKKKDEKRGTKSLPVCNRTWFLKVDDWLKHLLQNLQENGFSIVCMRMCERRLLRELKARLQRTHRSLSTWSAALGWQGRGTLFLSSVRSKPLYK